MKGVSGWDFDLASLKAEAENVATTAPVVAQPAREPLPSVLENAEGKLMHLLNLNKLTIRASGDSFHQRKTT